MDADERLAFVRLKVERSEKHLAELQAAIETFLATQPYCVVKKVDPEWVYEMAHVAPVPDCIGAIIGDAVQNLRSALDHLSYQLMSVATRDEPSDRQKRWSHFPIRETDRKYESTPRPMHSSRP